MRGGRSAAPLTGLHAASGGGLPVTLNRCLCPACSCTFRAGKEHGPWPWLPGGDMRGNLVCTRVRLDVQSVFSDTPCGGHVRMLQHISGKAIRSKSGALSVR